MIVQESTSIIVYDRSRINCKSYNIIHGDIWKDMIDKHEINMFLFADVMVN
jgi:hypothetical protein